MVYHTDGLSLYSWPNLGRLVSVTSSKSVIVKHAKYSKRCTLINHTTPSLSCLSAFFSHLVKMYRSERVELSWQQLPNVNKKIPSIRCNMSGGVYKDYLWLLMGAGAGVGRSSDVWKYHIKKGEWSLVSYTGEAPMPRDGHSATYIGAGKFLCFGGQGVPTANDKSFRCVEQSLKTRTLFARQLFNDVHEFDCEALTWTVFDPASGPQPMCRRQHSANYIQYHYGYIERSITDKKTSKSQPLMNKSSVPGVSQIEKRRNNQSHSSDPPIPNNSVLIFGGCGIEPIKKSEQVYNDIWAFDCDTRSWIQIHSKGPAPGPLSGHKSEVIGDTLVVIGGVPGTSSTSQAKSDQSLSFSSGVMTLNIRTLTWTCLDVRDSVGNFSWFR